MGTSRVARWAAVASLSKQRVTTAGDVSQRQAGRWRRQHRVDLVERVTVQKRLRVVQPVLTHIVWTGAAHPHERRREARPGPRLRDKAQPVWIHVAGHMQGSQFSEVADEILSPFPATYHRNTLQFASPPITGIACPFVTERRELGPVTLEGSRTHFVPVGH